MTALTPAERILKSLGIEAPGEIDLEAIAWTRGAVVDYRPLDRCEATIVGSKRKAVIAVNSRSPPERRRFSLAHELGHWHHHKGRMLFCGGRDVCNFANSPLDPERQEDDERGFDEEQVLTILTGTLAAPSHLISPEMKAARRWVPWICAYSGARISEITSLWPADIEQIGQHRAFVIKEGLAKSKKMRRVPVHEHLVAQDFL